MSLRGHRVGAAAHVPTERYLIVRVGSQWLALSAELVQGLLTLEESDSASVLTMQGYEYPPVAIVGRLGLTEGGDGPETRIVLLAQLNVRACFRVDQVHGLIEVERAAVLALPRQFRGDERNWYVGLIVFNEGVALGLSAVWLLAEAMQGSRGETVHGQRLPQLTHAVADTMGKEISC